MKEDDYRILKRVLNSLLVVAVIIAALGFVYDCYSTVKHGGIDLRNRVVGARCLMEGIDPYYFKWSPDKSELLLDPCDDLNMPISRVGVPPTVLILHSTIAALPYRTQRYIWFILQWSLFLLSLAIFSKSANSEVKSKIIWVVGLLFISGSFFWRLHVERGQMYILYTFLISLAYWVSQKSFKGSSIISGFLIGFTAALRPLVVFVGAPMLIYKKWKLLIGTVIGGLSFVFLSVLITGIPVWRSYVSAMRIMEQKHLGLIGAVDYRFVTPRTIEGMDNLASFDGIPYYDSSLQYVFQLLLGITLPSNILIVAFALTLLLIFFVLYKLCTKNISSGMLFLVGIVIVLMSRFFLPAWSFSYSNVIWLIPLSLIIINCDSLVSLLNPLIILLLIPLLFNISFVTWMPKISFVSDVAMVCYTAFTTLFILQKSRQIEDGTLSG